MAKARIGCVKYLNTAPLVEGLSALRDVEVISAVPARLIDMLAGGEVDVALCSTIDAARSACPVSLLPVGMIGCDGPTLTVRLFSAVPIGAIRQIHADTDSHTSAALVRVILARQHGLSPPPPVIDFDARERVALSGDAGEWPESLLLIGDKVVTDSPPAVRYPHGLDLGQAWKDLTGLPFVYAMWMCRAGEEDSDAVRTAATVLERTRRHNVTRLDWLIAENAPKKGWPRDLAAKYLKEYLRFEVGPREREAVERFLSEAADLGLAPRTAVRWVDLARLGTPLSAGASAEPGGEGAR